ncbi:MAG TPA: hypothetical protein VMT95_00930 [Candidatus Binatia bacterium]|nr:hypothetical protein [Candidatus Binatia bacterium]
MKCNLVFALVIAVAAAALFVGCNAVSAQSTSPGSVNPEVSTGVFPASASMSPTGHKRVGTYVWVWHTAKVSGSIKSIEAYCPHQYFVTGGGYRAMGAFVYGSTPDPAFDGWILLAYPQGSGPPSVSVTVYAACTPAK